MKEISVVIPVYNSAGTIGECLSAVYNSEFRDYEVIVVDDCSTDNTIDIAKRFRCRILKLGKNSGPAVARNLGVKNAEGDIIIFIDSDVLLDKDAVGLIARNFEDKNTMAVSGIYSKEPANKSWFNWYISLQKYLFWTKANTDEYSSFGPRLGAIRKSVFNEIEGFNPRFKQMEDYEFGRRLTEKYKVVLDKKIQGKHYHPSLKTCIRKYFERSHYWFRLFLKKKKFDNITTTASTGVLTMFGFLTWILFLSSLLSLFFLKSLFLPFVISTSISAIIFLYGNIRFFAFSFKEKGSSFMLYAIFIGYLLSFVIGMGIIYSVVTYPIDKL